MLLNCSILSDIDTAIETMDKAIDPFNILGVTRIKLTGEFKTLFPLIHYDALCKATPNFDENIYDAELDTPDFVIDSTQRRMCIRLAWYVCNELLYGNLNGVFFNIGIFSDYTEIIHIYRYQQTTDKESPKRIGVQLPSGANMTISHKNKINKDF